MMRVRKLLWFLACYVMVLAFVVAVALGLAFVVESPSQAAKLTLVPGQEYVFVVDCLPHILMPVIELPDGSKTRANPCMSEKLIIKSVSDDGWVEAYDSAERDTRNPRIWRINLARVYAIQKVESTTRLAA